MSDLEEAWRVREEEIYPRLFGAQSRGIFPLDPSVFEVFGDIKVDPRWLTHGVFEFAPTPDRDSWIFVTSGYSNPWEDTPEGSPSGAGIEFVLETDRQGDWAIKVLQKLFAYELCKTSGQMGGGAPLGLHDRIPLGGPIDGTKNCKIQSVLIVTPSNVADTFDLPSGDVMLVQFAGITDAERTFASKAGADVLLQRLEGSTFPVTQPDRTSDV